MEGQEGIKACSALREQACFFLQSFTWQRKRCISFQKRTHSTRFACSLRLCSGLRRTSQDKPLDYAKDKQKLAKTIKTVQKLTKIYKNVQKFTKIYKYLQIFTKDFKGTFFDKFLLNKELHSFLGCRSHENYCFLFFKGLPKLPKQP